MEGVLYTDKEIYLRAELLLKGLSRILGSCGVFSAFEAEIPTFLVADALMG